MQNPNCDGGGPCAISSKTVKLLPTGGDSNAILCFSCFCREIRYRIERNKDLGIDCKFDLPDWMDLKVYSN